MHPSAPTSRRRRLRASTTAGALATALVAGLAGLLPLGAVSAQEGAVPAFEVVEAPDKRVLRGSGEDRPSSVAASGPLLRARAAGTPTATFQVTYSGFTDQQRAAFQAAVDIWSHIVVSSVPIRIDAELAELPPQVLGAAGPAAAAEANESKYAIALANSLAGRDLAPDISDILATFSNDTTLFYFGTDGAVPAGQYDFTTTVLHEIGHGLGFLAGLEVVNGVGTYDPGSTDPLPFVFDRFLVRRTSQSDVRVLSYPRESVALADALESQALFWDGASATAAADGTNPRIYAPASFETGSSIGHLDEDTYAPGTRNALMTPIVDAQETSRDPGPIANAILEDQGWRLSEAADPTPPTRSSPSATPTATFAPSPSPSPSPSSGTGSRYTGLSPSRILDTRDGTGVRAPGRVGAGGTRDLQVTGRGGVPQDATAVVLNVTGVGASESTDVRVYPASGSSSVPAVSNLNLPRGGTRANLVTVPVGPTGAVRLRNQSGTVHLLADVAGYYAPTAAAAFFPLDPERVLDTRSGIGTNGRVFKLGGGQTLDLRVTGTTSVPPSATAVVLNVTASGASRPTDVRVYPTRFGDAFVPDVSNLNVGPGGPVPNLVIARVGDDGQVRFRNNSGTVSLLADIFGYYEASSAGALFRPVAPTRLLDSRPDRLGAAQVLDVDTDAQGPVPTGATAVALNVTGVGASLSTDLRVFPTPLSSTTKPPSVSTLNLVRGQTAAAAAVVRTGNGQAVRVYNNSGTVAVLVDVAGWFGPA